MFAAVLTHLPFVCRLPDRSLAKLGDVGLRTDDDGSAASLPDDASPPDHAPASDGNAVIVSADRNETPAFQLRRGIVGPDRNCARHQALLTLMLHTI